MSYNFQIGDRSDASSLPHIFSQITKSMATFFAPYKSVYIVLGVVWAFAFSVSFYTGKNIVGGLQDLLQFVLSGMMITMMIFLLAVCCVYKFIQMVRFERPESPLKELGLWLKQDVFTPAIIKDTLNIIVILYLLSTSFGFLKSMIPVLVPFSWDQAFMELDRFLFFGAHPWEVLQPFFGYPLITFLINVAYNLWMATLFAFFLLLIFLSKNHQLRLQYLMGTVLVWFIGGNLLATVLSSAGPCYFENIGLSSEPYAGLMAYLNHANELYPIWALQTQDLLWQTFSQPNSFSLISAMPSMHVATSVLFALLAWRLNVWFGWVMTGFAAIIFLGSIHLGWHYAVDGVLSLLITFPLWSFSGYLVKK